MPREIASPVFQGLSNLFDWLHGNGFKPTDSTVNARYVATRDVEFEVADVEMAALVMLILFEPYRMRRVTSFLDPWADPFGSGYQLTQSLMAFGRGSWFGEGLGNSIQKMEYLPEAHTDFVFAILGEELGYVGVLGALFLIFSLAVKALKLGHQALVSERLYEGYLAIGIGIWFSFQTFVNVGAASGMMPTKGLTLPLVSYGGSSLIIMMVAVSMLIRIDFELRQASAQARVREVA